MVDRGSFLQSAGGLDLLLQLEGEPHTFGDLEDALTVSTSTLNTRITEAKELGLVEETLNESKSSRSKIAYEITEKGKELCRNLPFDKEQYFELLEEFKKKKEELDRLRDKLNSFKEETAGASVEITDSEIKTEG